MAKPGPGGRSPATRGSATGNAGPPAGGSDSTTTEFLGGFPGDFEVALPGTRRLGPSGWGGHTIGTTTAATLAELRELGLGGYVSTDVLAPANLEPGIVAQLQVMLENAGLLGDDYSPGAYDEKTETAYRSLLQRANAMGTTWESALGRMQDNPFRDAAEEEDQKPLPRVTNPMDLRAVFKSAARKTLGKGNIPDEELDRMIAAYQGMETAAQQQETGTIVQPPDAEVFADDQLRRKDPVGYDSHKALTAFDGIAQLMRGESVA